jgi:NAD(P)-dependent dehydrogenase (short-subunit alcohol dehydrogenase family)
VDIKDQVGLITGGASGLGFATAQALVEQGARVVIFDLPGSPGQESAERLGGSAMFVPGDVRDGESMQAAVDAASDLGALRVAISCAGVATPGRVLKKGEPIGLDVFARVVEINLIGTFNLIRLASARMATNELLDDEAGVIITTASVAAFDGQVGQAAYAASKGGVAAMTLPIARDLADKKIRVVSIAPGIFETPMLASLPQETQDSLGKQVPHPSRLGKPSEYAMLVAQIVANPMLNGEVIRLDGAIRMGPR